MSLIKCTECGKEISDKAFACPSCGNPRQIPDTHSGKGEKVEIEMTSKKWKKRALLAAFLVIVGWFVAWKSLGLGIFLIVIGAIIGFTARLGAWWTNG